MKKKLQFQYRNIADTLFSALPNELPNLTYLNVSGVGLKSLPPLPVSLTQWFEILHFTFCFVVKKNIYNQLEFNLLCFKKIVLFMMLNLMN